jgi:alcohol dehydrogenase
MSQHSYIGEASIAHVKKILSINQYCSVFLVRGKSSYQKCGAKYILQSVFDSMNIKVVEFYDFSENPKVEDMLRGITLFEIMPTNVIIAVGGGSVIDMAKLIRFYYSYRSELKLSNYILKNKLVPLIAIPTTAGTGSEATHFAVLYKEKVKYSIEHKSILPDVAIVEPCFTFNLNPYLTACSGFDALSQSIESYWNVNATDESDEYAIKSLKLIWPNLPKVVKNGNLHLERIYIAEGAFYAGKAINITKSTLPHAMSYPFTSYYGFPHGHAVALSFPFFISYNTSGFPEDYNRKLNYNIYKRKMNNLFTILGIDNSESAFYVFHNYIENLGLSFNLPSNFCEETIIENINYQRAKNNPRKITKNTFNLAVKSISCAIY